MAQFKRRPMDVGFSQTPHGLWTLGVPTGARILLGWLHSHTDEFLAGITTNQMRRTFGTSSVLDWLEALAKAGFVRIERGGAGNPNSYELLVEPWYALHGRRTNQSDIGLVEVATSPKSDHHQSDIGAPKSDHSEEQGENITENTNSLSPAGDEQGSGDDEFEDWWKAYREAARLAGRPPGSKGSAFTAWTKLKGGEKAAAHSGLATHRRVLQRLDAPYVMPNGSVWLNQKRWLDDEPRQAPVVRAKGAAGAMDHLRKRYEEAHGGY